MDVNITGIATQGESYQKRFWTESYTLNFSSNGIDFYAHTPPSDGTNKEDKRVIINYIKNCCTQRTDQLLSGNSKVVLVWLLSLLFTTI